MTRPLPRRWVAPFLLGLVALAGVAGANPAGRPADGVAPPARTRIVLVSGRDDHGLLALHEVPLHAAPGGGAEVGRLHDGSLAWVVGARGEWLRVRAVDGGAEGWVDDYYLRGRAVRLAGPGAPWPERWGRAAKQEAGGQVVVVDAAQRAGAVWAAVRPVADPAAAPEWVPAALLLEVGARPGPADAHHRA